VISVGTLLLYVTQIIAATSTYAGNATRKLDSP